MTVVPEAAASARRARPRLRLKAFGWTGVAILVLRAAVAVVGPWILPLGANDLPLPDACLAFQTPQPGAWLGTDAQDRDVATRIVYGAGRTLGIALLATLLGFAIGIVCGVGSASAGGAVDLVVDRLNDAIPGLPSIMLGLIAIAAFGSSITVLIVMTGCVFAPVAFRLARALGMEVLTQDFVEATRLRGKRIVWVIQAEVWPNIWMPLLSAFGLRRIYIIRFVSSLGIPGLGIQPPQADWGSVLRANLGALRFGGSAWPVLAPGHGDRARHGGDQRHHRRGDDSPEAAPAARAVTPRVIVHTAVTAPHVAAVRAALPGAVVEGCGSGAALAARPAGAASAWRDLPCRRPREDGDGGGRPGERNGNARHRRAGEPGAGRGHRRARDG